MEPPVVAVCAGAERALARFAADGAAPAGPALVEALAALDGVVAAEPATARVLDAYRAEVLRALGRRPEAARAYARALLADADNAEALLDGARDLLDVLGGLEEAEQVLLVARARHPGRAWQGDALLAACRARRRLEAHAPISATDLPRLRAEVTRRLHATPCTHDDDRRPVTEAAARALGFDAARVLPWLAALGACCCDCQVAAVRGPREAR